MSKDNRVHRRVRPRSDQPVIVQIAGAGFIEMLKARDISSGGIGVHVPHHFDGCDLNSEVELIIKLPGQKAFLARGMIRHRAGRGAMEDFFGIQFTKLGKEDQERVNAFVDKRAAEGGLLT